MADQGLLVGTLVELADNLIDDFDIVDLLTLLADRCVETLDVAAAGVMLVTPAGSLGVVASSSDAMRALELFQLQSNEGPCVDCYRTGEPIINLNLNGLNGRWPTFTPHAIAAGYHSVHSLPMRLRGTTIGALNMFRTDDGALDEDEVDIAQAFADVATIAIIQHQAAADAKQLNEQLNNALQSRIVIEQAKGKISEATGVNMDLAFQRLRAHARSHNLRLGDLARNIAEGTVTPGSLDPHRPK
jgi:GAF domain-containing protein